MNAPIKHPTKIALQVGKAYRTRHGDVATIMFAINAQKEFVAIITDDEGQQSAEQYPSNGMFLSNDESCFDLVEEIK